MGNERLLVYLALCSVVALSLSTSGFTAASADRAVAVDVAEDPADALVGFVAAPEHVELTYGSNDDRGNDTASTAHRTVTLLELRNNLDGEVTYTVALEGDGRGPPTVRRLRFVGGTGGVRPSTVERPGGEAVLEADVVCASTGAETWTLRVVATAADFEAQVRHDVTVTCIGSPGRET